ncbi:GPO family capsid scaffolding protein [Pseudomonas sp. TH08]|uniref:GPO family capsid scaffolding protein n=1 Tax=unclassified Pseudomonas TaxID=196821 RepID=UPI00191414F8|nr:MULTISPECIES: GPO family capsid scaffolding protein [unclassified Pseudomonas]MBK5530984.1 GPO family capsid scaffolding protein [Pseudomonas sp. TH06]MBK5535512.1 GPO family capsid scaffolding protein [Pseudomonas sp. TH08]MBK5536650.1 GPO family capsid scaffolding protein [Pseudomonas sp. TH08]
MPRSLVSYWKRVATSGPTIDGRDILPQELRDIAETYTPAKYTAVIWCDHERWTGSHGTVFAVRLVEEGDDLEPGQIALEAQLKPNDRLLYLNDQGQKLFTSIEITPNFAGTGKAYLTGLAVTDEPASLGTQELYFSQRTSRAAYYAASLELGPLPVTKNTTETEPPGEIGRLATMFTRLFKCFGIEDTPTETTPQTPTESKPPMDEATATALKALLAQLLVVAAGIQAVIEPAAEDAPEPDQAPIDDVTAAVDDIVTTAEAEREFQRTGGGNKALLAAFTTLQKEFTALKNTTNGRQLPRSTGAADKSKVRVL